MTVLGKMLAVFVFLLSLVWFGLTAVVFSARSEWRKDALDARKVAQANADAYEQYRKQADAEIASLKSELAKASLIQDGLRKERNSAQQTATDVINTVKAGQDANVKLVPDVVQNQETIKTLQGQVNTYVAQNKTQGDLIDVLKITEQDAKQRQLNAELLLKSTVKALEEQVEKTRTIQEERLGATAAAGIEGFRGDVIDVRDDIVVFKGGLNAGVRKNMTFVVRRSVAPFFIGSVTINIDPDTQVSAGVFTPAPGQTAKGEYLPKKGDSIEPSK